jgi:hypothetical protein
MRFFRVGKARDDERGSAGDDQDDCEDAEGGHEGTGYRVWGIAIVVTRSVYPIPHTRQSNALTDITQKNA